MRKIVIGVGIVAAIMTSSIAASASPSTTPVPQGSGAGQSHLSAAFGFNMDLNGNGQFEYNADPAGPDAGFMGHCSGYSWVTQWVSWDGFPSMRFRSDSCVDQDGTLVHLRGKIIDRGEPGVPNGDYAHVLFCYQTLPNGHCPLKGASEVDDNGQILAGNIQILH